MAYSVVLKPSAKRNLDGLGTQDRSRIIRALERLAADPCGRHTVKLEAESDLYRVRVGNYRVTFTIENDRLVVLVLKIGHRREIYR